MMTVALAILAARQAPRSFDELETAKLRAFHNVKRLHLIFEANEIGGKASAAVESEVWKDGPRLHGILILPEGGVHEQIDDGVITWYIDRPGKKYYVTKDAATMPFDPAKNHLVCAPDNANFGLSTYGPVLLASDPMPSITSTEMIREGDDTLCRVVAQMVSHRGGRLTVTQWFLKDVWIPKRFKMTADSSAGAYKLLGQATTLELDPVIPSDEFTLDPKRIEGFSKVDGPPPGSFGIG
jgi:hypothetical protein